MPPEGFNEQVSYITVGLAPETLPDSDQDQDSDSCKPNWPTRMEIKTFLDGMYEYTMHWEHKLLFITQHHR